MVRGEKNALVFAAIVAAQAVKTNGWTEPCIHIEIIYISNMYLYSEVEKGRERQGETVSQTRTIFSPFLMHSGFFILLRTISHATFIDASFSFQSCNHMI